MAGKQLSDLENDRHTRLLTERNFEIISEASRHLPDDLKVELKREEQRLREVNPLEEARRRLVEQPTPERQDEQKRDTSRGLFEDYSQGRMHKPDNTK